MVKYLINLPKNRPISLLASISDFDRQAAQIVEQRLKDEEKRRRVNDESFYVKNSSNDGTSGSAKTKEPQEAIDEIMANVEQKMECLDAIGKHNSRWEKRISNDIPNIDMNGLVSDLNQFLNTTKKELMTPRTKRKQEMLQAKQKLEEESKQIKQAEHETSTPREQPKPKELSPASIRKQEIEQAKQQVEEESKQMKQKKKVKEEIQEVDALLQECTQALKQNDKQKEDKSKQIAGPSKSPAAAKSDKNRSDHSNSKDAIGTGKKGSTGCWGKF